VVKVVLGAVGAVLLVLAGGAGGYVLAEGDGDSGEREAALPPGWALCSNHHRGFAIGYPARWHTDAAAAYDSCEYFDPEPFDVPAQSDFSGTALEVDPDGEDYTTVVDGLVDRRFARVLARRETTVLGRRALRIETEPTGEGFQDRGVKATLWVVDRDGDAFVVGTPGLPGKGDYATRQATLDRAIETLTFFTPTAVPLADGRVLPHQAELPDPVERSRIAIAEAAAARDYDALARLIPDDGFEYTFGGPVPGGPTAYWRRLEASTDEAPLERLVAGLALPYAKVRGIYVWPFAFDRDPKQLTEEELELLSTFATPREIEGWREFGGYIGWRAGIEPDGDWIFYVAGD
jgi:hypothetical protein